MFETYQRGLLSNVDSDPSPINDALLISDASDAEDVQSVLPAGGEVRWGFLKLDSQEARFIID